MLHGFLGFGGACSAALLVFSLAAAPASAAVLAQWQAGSGTASATSFDWRLFLGPTNDPFNDQGHIFLGDGDLFSLSDAVGTSFTYTALDDPDFAAFEASLTDGLAVSPNWWGNQSLATPGGGGGANFTSGEECDFITNVFGGSCVGAVDLAGYDIQSITFELIAREPWPSPTFSGVWMDVEFTIEGELVPEPHTGALLALGFAMLGVRRRRRAA